MSKSLSVIIPVYNEQESIIPLVNQLKTILNGLNIEYEVIFVDDGSNDYTFKRLAELKKKYKDLILIQLRKNLGKSVALNVGFKSAKGKVLITMDGDLQDDPNEIPKFLDAIKEYDLVVGWKYKREDPFSKKILSKIFNILTRYSTGLKIHDFNCGFKAFRREVVHNLQLYGELYRYIPAIVYSKGFRVGEIKIKHRPRIYGKYKYGASRLFKGFMDLMTLRYLITYNKRPLHFFGFFGLITIALGSLIVISNLSYHIIKKGILQLQIGPLLLLGSLLVVFGMQFIVMGFLGEMIAYSNRESEEDDIIKK